MYTTGDLDKSTHKKLMYVESQHMSGDEEQNNGEYARLQIDRKLSNSMWFLNESCHVLKSVPHTNCLQSLITSVSVH